MIAYGYGPAESYGYTGGMAFERLYQPTIALRVLDRQASPGMEVDLVVVVDTILQQPSVAALGIASLRATLSYDRTIFVPQMAGMPSQVQRGEITFTHTFDSLAIGDTVGVLPGTAVLGRVVTDTVAIAAATWFNDAGEVVTPTGITLPGVLTITDICEAGGRPRLFDPLASAPIVRIYNVMGREIPGLQEGLNLIVTTANGRTTVQKEWRTALTAGSE